MQEQAIAARVAWNPVWGRALCLVLWLLFAVVLVRTAWITDDAFITLRTADNIASGFGPRWNVAERVQAYTHPLWLATLTLPYLLTHEAYYTTLCVSLAISLAVAALLGFGLGAAPQAAAVGLTATLFSRAFIDYSTSGLENPLTHLLLLLFVRELFREPLAPRRFFFLGLIAGAGMLTRIDAVLLFAPALLVAFARQRKPMALAWMAAGFVPVALWELFSLFYYGIPYPNTYLGKLNTGIPAAELAQQGLHYLQNSLWTDPVTLAVIVLALAAAAMHRGWRELSLAAGIVLYLLYVVRIGGDFMSERFLSAPFLLGVAVLVKADFFPFRLAKPACVALIVVLGFITPHPTVTSGRDFGMDWDNLIDGHGIADERRFYFNTAGMLSGSKGWVRPVPRATRKGRQAKRGAAPILAEGAIGVHGYYAGPAVHIVDYHALADPLLSRLPAVERDPLYVNFMKDATGADTGQRWRVGHYLRTIPPGYLPTLLADRNVIADENLAKLYDKLALITRGPLWDRKRLLEIVRMNLGAYRDLVDPHHPPYQPVDWGEVIALRPDHAEGYYQRAEQHEQQGLPDAGRWEDLQRAIALDPRHVMALADAAQDRLEAGDFDGAIGYAERSLAVEPDDVGSLATLGNALCSKRDLEHGIALLLKALELDRDAERSLYRPIGVAYSGLGRNAEALQWLQRSLAAYPRDARTRYYMGIVLAGQGKAEEASAMFEKALELDPGLEDAALQITRSHLAAGDAVKAQAVLERFVSQNPQSAAAHYRLAEMLLKQGQAEPASRHLEQAVRLAPESAELRADLARAHFMLGRYEEALGDLREALRLRPDYFLAHHRLGLVLLAVSRPAEAVKAFEATIAVEPSFAEAQRGLAQALRALGNEAGAERALARYTELARQSGSQRSPDTPP